jgi:putative redox protein
MRLNAFVLRQRIRFNFNTSNDQIIYRNYQGINVVEKTAYIKQIKGISFAGKTDSNHWIVMDGPEKFGGSNAAVRPKELLLLGLGGCTGSDVVSILNKKRVKLEDFEINITSDVSEEYPQVFTKMHIEYVFYGNDISETDVERAIELSQTKYCGVTRMLGQTAEITHNYRIVRTEEVAV